MNRARIDQLETRLTWTLSVKGLSSVEGRAGQIRGEDRLQLATRGRQMETEAELVVTEESTAPLQKQRTAWTAAVEASFQRGPPTRSELPASCCPEPSEPLPAAAAAGRPLAVHQSAVAPAELHYPSGLHRLGRLMVMVTVTSACLCRHAAPLLTALPTLHIETCAGGLRLVLS